MAIMAMTVMLAVIFRNSNDRTNDDNDSNGWCFFACLSDTLFRLAGREAVFCPITDSNLPELSQKVFFMVVQNIPKISQHALVTKLSHVRDLKVAGRIC